MTTEQAIIDKHVEKVKAQVRAACVNDNPPPTEEEIQEGAEFLVGQMLEGMGRHNPFAGWEDDPGGYKQEQADLDNDDRAIGMQP